MLKSLRRKKTREGQHTSMSSIQSARTNNSFASQQGRNLYGDVIVISTAEDSSTSAPLAPPPSSGLSPSPPSNPFARSPKPASQPTPTYHSTGSYGSAAPSLGVGDKILPDETNFRSSLILPHLERRFSLMQTISPDAMRSQLRAQRARAQANRRPFLTEEEEEEIINQLQYRIVSNVKARGDSGSTGKDKIGILLPPINDHPWDSVIERGTDGFGGYTPIYAVTPAPEAGAVTSPPLANAEDMPGSPASMPTSPKTTDGATSAETPTSPSRKDTDDRVQGALFASRGVRADAAYMRTLAKQRASGKPTDATGQGSTDTNDTGASVPTSPQLAASAGVGNPPVEPPQIKIGRRESILSSTRSSTSSNRPPLSALQGLSPASPSINITSDTSHEASTIRRDDDADGAGAFRSHLQQRHSKLLTTLSPEAFKRVSTALDELFDHFRAEAAISPDEDEDDDDAPQNLLRPGLASREASFDSQVERRVSGAESRDSVTGGASVHILAGNTAPLSIRNSTSAATSAGSITSATTDSRKDEMRAAGQGTAIAMPGGLGLLPPVPQSTATTPASTRPNSGSAPFPSHLGPAPSPPAQGEILRHARTFSIDSLGSSASSMVRYGMGPPAIPSKRTSSLPKRERRARERASTDTQTQAQHSSAGSPNLGGPALSERQKGKQREGSEGSHAQPAATSTESTPLVPSASDAVGAVAAGVGGLATAITAGAVTVAAAAVTALLPRVDDAVEEEQAQVSETQSHLREDSGSTTVPERRSTTPRAVEAHLSPRSMGPPPSRDALPVPPTTSSRPIQTGSKISGTPLARPRMEHVRGASTFSQMSFTSADTFQSAEDGGTVSGSSVAGANRYSDDDEVNLGDRAAFGVGPHALQAQPIGGASLRPPEHTLGTRVRALSGAGSIATSGRGSFTDDEADDDDAEDAFQYDRRTTLRAMPRSPALSSHASGHETGDGTSPRLGAELTPNGASLGVSDKFSPRASSTGTTTRQPSPVVPPEVLATASPTFGPSRGLEADTEVSNANLGAQLGSPFPDVPGTMPGGFGSFRPPSTTSGASVLSDSASQASARGRSPASGQTAGPPPTGPAHRRGASASSVTSFTGDVNLIGAHNIGSRRRSSNSLATRTLPPTSAATISPTGPGSVWSSVASGGVSVPAAGPSPPYGHSCGRSGSADARSIESVARTTASPQIVNKKSAVDLNGGEPMNLAGPASTYAQGGMRGFSRPGHMPVNSSSSFAGGHQRYGSATQLSFDSANGRIRVGPSVPNAHTFASAGSPPAMMTHSASGTVGAPVIDSPQSPPNGASQGFRHGAYGPQTSPVPTSGQPAAFDGPVPMMQMSPQSGHGTPTSPPVQGQSAFASMHRQRLSNQASSGSLNRIMSGVPTGAVNGVRPSSTTSSNGAAGFKSPPSAAGVSGVASSVASTGQRSPYQYGHSASPVTLSREPSDSSHASRWNRPGQHGQQPSLGGPPSTYQTQLGSIGLTKRPSDVSLASTNAAQAQSPSATAVAPAMTHHSSNPSIAGSIRGSPNQTTVLTAGAIAARNAQNYGPQYHRTRARSNSGSSAQVQQGASASSLGLAGFFAPSPPTTPGSGPGSASQGISQLLAQQNAAAASGGFKAAASANQVAVAQAVDLPSESTAPLRRAPHGPTNPPGFSFPSRGLREPMSSMDTQRPTKGDNGVLSPNGDAKSIRSVSDINASSDEEVATPAVGRMSVGEDVWATVARNTSMKRTEGSGKTNKPGSRAASVKSPEPGVPRKRSKDLLSASNGEAFIPLHTDSSVLTPAQLAEIQLALARSESQRSVSRTGAPSRLEASPPPVPTIPESMRGRQGPQLQAGSSRDTELRSGLASPISAETAFFSPREEIGQDQALGSSLGGEAQTTKSSPLLGSNGVQSGQPSPPAALGTPTIPQFATPVLRTPPPTSIAARTPVLASTLKSEVMYDVTTSHRPTSPTFSHRSKRSDLPSLLDLSAQTTGFRAYSPIPDLDEHALSLSQAIDEANARQLEYTFPTMTPGHRRGNSSIDSRISGRSPFVQGSPQVNSGLPEAIREESVELENNSRVASPSRTAPRRSKSHDQLTNMPPPPTADDAPRTPASETHATMGPRLVDDVAAQTRAATRALKGPAENASLAIPKRSRTLSKRKSQKKLNKIISQPQLITTSQRLDHAADIQLPDVWLSKTLSTPRRHQGPPASEHNADSVRSGAKSDTSGKTLHRRHSSSFGHSGDFKNQWAISAADADSSVGTPGIAFPSNEPSTPSSAGHFGRRIFGKFRSRKRTGDQSIFDKFTSPNAASKSTTALTKSPASSFGHATLAPEPMSMLGEIHANARSPSDSAAAGGSFLKPGAASTSPNAPVPQAVTETVAVPRNTPKADRNNRLRLVSALSFGSPLDQAIGESIEAHLGPMPEEEETPAPSARQTLAAPSILDEQAKTSLSTAPSSEALFQQSPTSVRVARIPTNFDPQGAAAKSARDTIVRRTIIIPTDSAFEKRKSTATIDGKRKSRTVKHTEDKEFSDRNVPPSPNPQVLSPPAEKPTKRDSARKSLSDRPPTPPGPAGVSGLHRRKISADMLADQPLPKPAKEFNLEVPASTSQGSGLGGKQGGGLLPSASLTSLLMPSASDKLAPPLPSPATTSIYSHGNGSLYDFYLNGDEDEDEGRDLQPSPSMEKSTRNHIEITERADGSVVWQVLAGLAERGSLYSDDVRLSYLSGGSQIRNSISFRGQRGESIYVPEQQTTTVSGLTPDDSRSFFAPKRAGHRKSFSFGNHPMPAMPSAISSSDLGAGSSVEQLAPDAGRQSSTLDQSSPKQFTTPIGFDMATNTGGPSTRIVYTNDADLATLLENFAQGKDTAKFDFFPSDQGGLLSSASYGSDHDQSRQRVEAEIYTLLNDHP